MSINSFNSDAFISLLNHLNCGLIIEENDKILWFNQYIQNVLQLSHNKIELLPKDSFSYSLLLKLTNGSDEIKLEYTDKPPQLFNRHTHSLKIDNNKIYQIHYLNNHSSESFLRDDLKLLRDQLLECNFRDTMTGLLSEKAFHLVLEPQIARCRRYHNPLAAIAIQLTFSSDQGNVNLHAEHIRISSHKLRELIRWADQLHYNTNNIFTIILPETSAVDASALIAKIESQLNSYPWLQLVTFGITEWTKTDTLHSFLKRTSLALETAVLKKIKTTLL